MQHSNPVCTFEAFLSEWLIRQETFLDELRNSMHQTINPNGQAAAEEEEEARSDLVARVFAHYLEYFNAKSSVAQDSILLVFSPTWFTPFEKTFLWIAGFKPGLAFHLVKTFVLDLNDDQRLKIEQARKESRLEERDLMEELTRIQETIAAPPIYEMARRAATAVDGELVGVESALDSLKIAMEELLECADFLRLKTLMSIMEILRSSQNVMFFAALARFQLQVRRSGLELQAAAAAASSAD
ncbi:unnamed protein product [Rhodiola kirilowii]